MPRWNFSTFFCSFSNAAQSVDSSLPSATAQLKVVSMRSENPYALHPSLNTPKRCLLNSFNVRLTDDGPLSRFQRRSSSASSFHAYLLQMIGGVMFLALCQQVVSQAPQHFRSSETQASCNGCFVRQPVCSVISLHRSMSRAVGIHPQEFTNFRKFRMQQQGLRVKLRNLM